MNLFKTSVFLMLYLLSQNSWASPESERAYLMQLHQACQAMLPVILAAEKQQDKNARIQFHYHTWRDTQGKTHLGLWEEVQEMCSGLQQSLQQPLSEPRSVQTIQGDYQELKS